MADVGSPQQNLLAGFQGTELPAWLERRLVSGLAGVCLFASNVDSPAQLRRLTSSIRCANDSAVIAIDEEGGDVTRLYADSGSPYPGNAVLGRLDDLEETERHGRLIAEQLVALGCNLNFAPCIDVNSNPMNPIIGVRSFGADAALVARHGASWLGGHQGAGVAACAKHFPGHGDTTLDSHLELPTVDRSLDQLVERELLPFQTAVDAGVWAVMTSHILLPQLDACRPATFSPAILQTMLRDRLGFDGVIVSDALDMAGASASTGIPEAAVRALEGGCDLLCIGADTSDAELAEIETAISVAVEQERLAVARIHEAVDRVQVLGTRLATAARPEHSRSAPSHFGDPLGFEPGAVAAQFELTGHATAVLARLPAESGVTLVRMNTTADIASGPTPWGPFAAMPSQGSMGHRFTVIDAWPGTPPPNFRRRGATVLIGRNNHRHAWVRDLISRCRRHDPGILVVEMGWPDEGHAYADIATFGSSRSVGHALLGMLVSGRAAPHQRKADEV